MSSALTLFIAWLLRRDASARSASAESTRVGELERRIAWLELNTVSMAVFSELSRRLDGIASDIREIRAFQASHMATHSYSS
jgi:hypothetical protein